ncbi:SIR2 family protein [Veillonella sp.]|uniref:SIR2 family protein n=1 Tax=Veillonella sp. TaxID=1926307 RepID=UPI001B685C40|nr:SIR2 family protein [Veillonella sp.]MBP8616534.1 SIR2 family protein [Veillonella sp.]
MINDDFYQKIAGNNINFLIGSGMSTPLYKTLALPTSVKFSFEDVLTHKNLSEASRTILYIYYYLSIIQETRNEINIKPIADKPEGELDNNERVVYNYSRFVQWMNKYLLNIGVGQPKRINVFTTNYDLLFERIFDSLLKDNPLLWFNEGSRGFLQRMINSENYNINISHSGFNDNYRRDLSLVNLYKLHGSVLWKYSEDKKYIYLDETFELFNKIDGKLTTEISKVVCKRIKNMSSTNLEDYVSELNNKNSENEKLEESLLQDFYELYKQIPIVNPNKGKFEETVFNQYYYQLLRAFSYELEKKQTTLIVFGFSFADEHIRSIVKRSLLNPELQVFIIPFSPNSYELMMSYFGGYPNVHFIPDFKTDNQTIRGNFDYLLDLLGAE